MSLASSLSRGYLLQSEGKTPVHRNPDLMVSSVRHLCYIFYSSSTNVGFFIGYFGPRSYIHSFSYFSHSLFSGPKQVTSSGCSLLVMWGGHFRIVMSSSNAASINVVDICVKCPSNRRSSSRSLN